MAFMFLYSQVHNEVCRLVILQNGRNIELVEIEPKWKQKIQ